MITLIKDATLVGESEPISIAPGENTGQETHSFQIETTGSPSSVTVSINGTIGGSSYNQLLQHVMTAEELAAGSAVIHLVNKPMPLIKASIDALTGGATPTVSVYYFKGIRSV